MKLRAVGNTHVGLKRKINEDSYIIKPDLGLYVIADGMGGHKAGEVASRMVVETMEDYWKKFRSNEIPSFLETIEEDVSENAKHLINSIALSNIIVHEAQKKPQYLRMGTTVSAVISEDEMLWAANVGDSPVYIYTKGNLILISEEHSIEAEQKSMGFHDPLGSTNPLMKNMLTRVMGLNEKVDVFITKVIPEAGDIVLLCSDGLINYLSENAIKTILDDFSMPLERKVNVLIEEANKGGGGDNITVILLEIQEEGTWDKFKKRIKTIG
jgi:serine/threonine protein phosphatase PrpC